MQRALSESLRRGKERSRYSLSVAKYDTVCFCFSLELYKVRGAKLVRSSVLRPHVVRSLRISSAFCILRLRSRLLLARRTNYIE